MNIITLLVTLCSLSGFLTGNAQSSSYRKAFQRVFDNFHNNHDTVFHVSYQYQEFSSEKATDSLLMGVDVSGYIKNRSIFLDKNVDRDVFAISADQYGMDSSRMDVASLMFQGTRLTDFLLSRLEPSVFGDKALDAAIKGNKVQYEYAIKSIIEGGNEYVMLIKKTVIDFHSPKTNSPHLLPISREITEYLKVNKSDAAIEECYVLSEDFHSYEVYTSRHYERLKKIGSKYVPSEIYQSGTKHEQRGEKKYAYANNLGMVVMRQKPIDLQLLEKTSTMQQIDNIQRDLRHIIYHNFDSFCVLQPMNEEVHTKFQEEKAFLMKLDARFAGYLD